MDKIAGVLEVGISEDGREVVVNHPDLMPDANGVGHIVFSPNQARSFRDQFSREGICKPDLSGGDPSHADQYAIQRGNQ